MYVKPADRKVEGAQLVVRDPDLLDFLPAEGREVPDSDYWHRRVRDGDVVLLEKFAAPAAGEKAEQLPGEITDRKAYDAAVKAGAITELPTPQADA